MLQRLEAKIFSHLVIKYTVFIGDNKKIRKSMQQNCIVELQKNQETKSNI